MLSLVVPVYNEEQCVEKFIDSVRGVLDSLGHRYEIVFVDDGSVDHTCLLIRSYAAKDARIKLVEFSYNHGKQAAVTAGIANASGDLLLYMDPDLQDPPDEIPRFLDAIGTELDVVYGVRLAKKDTLLNTLFSRLFWWTLRRFTGLSIPPGMAVMRIFNRRFADAFLRYGEQNRFIEGIFMHIGMRAATLPIEQGYRFAGTSKFNFKRRINLAMDAILDFSEIPLRSTVKLGVALSLLGGLAVFAIVAIKLIGVTTLPGWASLLSLSLLAFGVQLSFLGIVALYVGRIYRETKRRPLYSVRDRVNLAQRREDD
jgi:dolichol-phosphate mannosyltransferase